MVEVGYFDVKLRQREKQEARERDERLIASSKASPQQIGQWNGLFSALRPSQARIVQRRAEVRVA